MTIRLFATDLDGTLLNLDSMISPESTFAVRNAQEKGLKITVATGRVYSDALNICQEGGIRTPIIGSNGATIHDQDGQLIYHLPLEPETAASVMKWLEEHEIYYEASTNLGIFAPQNGHQAMLAEMDRVLSTSPSPNIERMIKGIRRHFTQKHFHSIETYHLIPSDAHVYNIMAFALDPEALTHGREYFRSRSDVAMVVSAPQNFEMQHPDVSKGNALTRLAAHLEVDMKDTAAVGDNFNDVSMLQMAGLGIAMSNAEPEVRALAKAVTLTNIDNGVAHAIQCILEGRPVLPT